LACQPPVISNTRTTRVMSSNLEGMTLGAHKLYFESHHGCRAYFGCCPSENVLTVRQSSLRLHIPIPTFYLPHDRTSQAVTTRIACATCIAGSVPGKQGVCICRPATIRLACTSKRFLIRHMPGPHKQYAYA
jgi:hypothetical protein